MDAAELSCSIDVIIVHFHAAASVRDAVAALRDDATASNVGLNIIVADNGSTAEERGLLESLGVDSFAIGRNGGYAGAVDLAFPRTRSDSIILMNEDVIVLPGCLRALHVALESGATVAGPQFFWDRDCNFLLPCTEERTRRNELLKVAGKRSLAKLERARNAWRQHARRFWRSRDPIATTALSGAMLAFRRQTWHSVGPLDQEFRLYFEENDWLLRVARAGFQSWYVPAAKAIHLHNPARARAPERLRWESESFLRFGNRYYGERFMRRLLLVSKRQSVIPNWPAFAADISQECAASLWIEVTPSPLGFPAAASRLADSRWPRLPPFLEGTFYLQLVDDIGRELRRDS